MFKPNNYNSVSPYFIVDDAPRFIKLLSMIFDMEELRVYRNEDGAIMHSEYRLEDTVIMIANSTENYPANEFLMHVYVKDVDDTFQKALDANCECIQLPKTNPDDPDKRGMFKDFAGNVWAVGTQL